MLLLGSYTINISGRFPPTFECEKIGLKCCVNSICPGNKKDTELKLIKYVILFTYMIIEAYMIILISKLMKIRYIDPTRLF